MWLLTRFSKLRNFVERAKFRYTLLYRRRKNTNAALHAYMKSPACFGYPSKVGDTASERDGEGDIKLRKVLYTGKLSPDQTYYICFKELHENPSAFFDLDFFEFAPKSVYDGEMQEDIW